MVHRCQNKKRLLEEIERVGMIERIRLKIQCSIGYHTSFDSIQRFRKLLSINETFGLVFVGSIARRHSYYLPKVDSGVDGYDFADKWCSVRIQTDWRRVGCDSRHERQKGMLRNDLHYGKLERDLSRISEQWEWSRRYRGYYWISVDAEIMKRKSCVICTIFCISLYSATPLIVGGRSTRSFHTSGSFSHDHLQRNVERMCMLSLT